MPRHDWNERYIEGDAPWDSGEPDEHLVEFLRSSPVERGRALDVGCGTGTNSLWLAEQGFAVLGIDIAPAGIEKARAKLAGPKQNCRFVTADFLNDTVSDVLFDLVFDRGCFHVFDKAKDRERFAQRVALLLKRGGRWLSLIGSTEGPEREFGPPRRSARDVISAIEPELEILELRSIEFRADLPPPPAAWMCLSRPRLVPAQPSTQRDQRTNPNVSPALDVLTEATPSFPVVQKTRNDPVTDQTVRIEPRGERLVIVGEENIYCDRGDTVSDENRGLDLTPLCIFVVGELSTSLGVDQCHSLPIMTGAGVQHVLP